MTHFATLLAGRAWSIILTFVALTVTYGKINRVVTHTGHTAPFFVSR